MKVGASRNVPKNKIVLNKGAQYSFVTSDARHSAYMGGVGAGKTFALCVKMLRFLDQPKIPGENPPVGAILSISLPVLKDFAIPTMRKVLDMAGIKYRYMVNDRKYILSDSGAEIWLRGMDEPDRIRGIECVCFGIDEGRNFKDAEAYKILVGRMRQGVPDDDEDIPDIWVPGQNYKHAGWVCSTPHGFDWMYYKFHPKNRDTEDYLEGSEWFNASTMDNKKHLPKEYILDLKQQWKGRFYDQEVLGKFVGVISGAVFGEFDPDRHTRKIEYNPDLPLYSFWDFGIGDAGVCIFAQLDWKELSDGEKIHKLPYLYILDAIEMTDAKVSEWAQAYFKWCRENTKSDEHPEGTEPLRSWGDPAGGARNAVSGTSVLRELRNRGIKVIAAPKRPVDEGLVILQNLIEGDQFLINKDNERLVNAVTTYRWKIDDRGVRLADKPVHDWTSHFCDALRYGALGLIGLGRRHVLVPSEETKPGTFDYIMEQLKDQDTGPLQLGDEPRTGIIWHPDEPVGLEGLL